MITANTITPAQYKNMVRGKRNRQTGENAQAIARSALMARGFHMIEPVLTGWGVKRCGKRIVGAWPLEKVSGDFRAITTYGLSVLVEVKCRSDGILSLSDFAIHQRAALDMHKAHNGVTLIAWVYNGKCRILQWPEDAPVDGKPLKWQEGKGEL